MRGSLFGFVDSEGFRPCPTGAEPVGRGVTLIEVLIGILVITIASVATLQFFSYGMGGIGKQTNKRAALERARQRLEELLEAPLTDLPGSESDGNLYWCKPGSMCTKANNSWVASNSPIDCDVQMVVDGQSRKTQTFAQWIDDPTNGVGPAETIQIGVKVWFMPGTTDDDFNRVYLKTLRTP